MLASIFLCQEQHVDDFLHPALVGLGGKTMARKLRRLTYEDRLILENMLKQDTPLVKIAEEVGVTRQCIYKELQRNGKLENRRNYNADEAQKRLLAKC